MRSTVAGRCSVRLGRRTALDQQGVAELVCAVAVLLHDCRHALERLLTGESAQQLEVAVAGLVQSGQDRIDDTQPAPTPDPSPNAFSKMTGTRACLTRPK